MNKPKDTLSEDDNVEYTVIEETIEENVDDGTTKVTDKKVTTTTENKEDDTEDLEDERIDLDTRSGHEGESDDEKRQRRREERRSRREKRRDARLRDARTIVQQEERIRALEEMVGKNTKQIIRSDVEQAIRRRDAASESIKAVDEDIARAVTSGDGSAVVELMRKRGELDFIVKSTNESLERFKKVIDSKKTEAAKPQATQTEAEPEDDDINDREVKLNAKRWLKKNNWFKTDLSDIDSRIVAQVEAQVREEDEFDPGTKDYWDEVDKRASKYLPHRYKTKESEKDDDRDDNTKNEGGNGKSKGPFVSGSSREAADGASTKKIQIKISPERKRAMMEAGVWEDPEKRARMLKAYAKYDAENAK